MFCVKLQAGRDAYEKTLQLITLVTHIIVGFLQCWEFLILNLTGRNISHILFSFIVFLGMEPWRLYMLYVYTCYISHIKCVSYVYTENTYVYIIHM